MILFSSLISIILCIMYIQCNSSICIAYFKICAKKKFPFFSDSLFCPFHLFSVNMVYVMSYCKICGNSLEKNKYCNIAAKLFFILKKNKAKIWLLIPLYSPATSKYQYRYVIIQQNKFFFFHAFSVVY
jgi:hypothetical protein